MRSLWLRRSGLAALLAALVLMAPATQAAVSLPASDYKVRHGELNEREMAVARNAWAYFVANTQPTTGLVNAVNKYPSTTMWDSASYLAALTAARELGIIDKAEFDRRLLQFMATLNKLVLFQNQVPNKVYNTITGQKVNYLNKPGEIGFSAIDIGRMLLWLKIIKERYPEHGNSIDNVVLGWDFTHVVDDCGMLYGAYVDGKNKRSTCRKADSAMRSMPPPAISCGDLPPARRAGRSLTRWLTSTACWCPTIRAIRA